VSGVSLKPFVTPEKSLSDLPQVKVCHAQVKAFRNPEQTGTVLPQVTRPYIDVNYVKNEKSVRLSLPELRNISKVSMVFKKPEKSEAGIPSFVKPKVRMPHSEKQN